MATIKLKTPPARKTGDPRNDRTPVRGTTAARKRTTLSGAQEARAEREARYQTQLHQRYGDAPPDSARRGPEPDRRDAPRKSAPRGPADARGAPPERGRGAAFDPARRDPRDPRDARDPRSPRDASDARNSRPPRRDDARPTDPRDARPPRRDDPRSTGPRDDRAPRRDDARAAPRTAPRAGPRDDSRPEMPRGTNKAGRDARPAAPYRGTQDDGRASRPAAPYQGPRDDGRALRSPDDGRALRSPDEGRARRSPDEGRAPGSADESRSPRSPDDNRPFKPKTDAFGNARAAQVNPAPAQRGGPQPSARANATARRTAAAWQQPDEDDDERDDRPSIPGSVRLSKRMSELGIASRREADEWIPKGWVRVDGRVVAELGSRVMPEQQITIDAKAKFVQAQKVTVLINKPIGFVSGQAEDGYEPASVLVKPDYHWKEDQSGIAFLKEHLRFLAPAGRLDIDSTGLLVLTQDGRIAKQLIGEDRETEKEYLVRVQTENGKRLPESELQKLRHGLELDGEALLPAQVEWLNDDQLRFVLKEGKKRQIRRMCELVGLKVVGLKRVRIGKVMLGDLPLGAWRYLRLDEGFI